MTLADRGFMQPTLSVTMTNCSSACLTKDHATFGECIRAKALQVAPIANLTGSRAWDAELNAYRSARSQGIQPSGTTMKQVRDAEEISQRTGKAFNAEDVVGSIT
jgi:hypothetical protein